MIACCVQKKHFNYHILQGTVNSSCVAFRYLRLPALWACAARLFRYLGGGVHVFLPSRAQPLSLRRSRARAASSLFNRWEAPSFFLACADCVAPGVLLGCAGPEPPSRRRVVAVPSVCRKSVRRLRRCAGSPASKREVCSHAASHSAVGATARVCVASRLATPAGCLVCMGSAQSCGWCFVEAVDTREGRARTQFPGTDAPFLRNL